jgi:hypothetical protein
VDIAEMFRLAEEAQDVLDQTLTEEDKATLQEVYKDFSGQIRWGRVIDNAFPILLGMVEELLEADEMAKEGGPWDMVNSSDMLLFEDGDDKSMARKHSLLLMLAKKLLGGLKTRMNQSMKDIRVLSVNEEIELEALVEAAEETERELRMDEEEIDEDEETPWEEESAVARHEVVANIDIAPEGDCRQSGRHIRTTVRWKRLNGDMFQETYCKDCRQVVKKVAATKRTLPSPKVCQHPGAEWLEGQEGREAVCTECKGPIENPDTYQWITAGLEPFGDDPTTDEAITLCSDY